MSSATVAVEKENRVAPLEGSSNYRTWKFSMKMVLMSKDIWGVVDGSEVKADEDKEWEKKDQKALALISLSVTQLELHKILDCIYVTVSSQVTVLSCLS
jgi:hypothetical protein